MFDVIADILLMLQYLRKRFVVHKLAMSKTIVCPGKPPVAPTSFFPYRPYYDGHKPPTGLEQITRDRPLPPFKMMTAAHEHFSAQFLAKEKDLKQKWQLTCAEQLPLTKFVAEELEKNYGVHTTYTAECLKPYIAVEATSVPVYAFVLFERFKAKFEQDCATKGITLEQAQLQWFNAIPTEQIGTNLECMSNEARKFTNSPGGVHRVVFAMCARTAFKMLEGYDHVKLFKAHIVGAAMFQNETYMQAYINRYMSKTEWDKWETAKSESKYDFKRFEIVFCEKMLWDLMVKPRQYMALVTRLLHVDIDPSSCSSLQFRCLKLKQAKNQALLAMLKEAAGPRPRLGRKKLLTQPTHPNRPVPDPSFWAAWDAKEQRRKAQRPSRPLSPW